jgi:hypothetical protein
MDELDVLGKVLVREFRVVFTPVIAIEISSGFDLSSEKGL